MQTHFILQSVILNFANTDSKFVPVHLANLNRKIIWTAKTQQGANHWIYSTLKHYFGYDSLQPGQKERWNLWGRNPWINTKQARKLWSLCWYAWNIRRSRWSKMLEELNCHNCGFPLISSCQRRPNRVSGHWIRQYDTGYTSTVPWRKTDTRCAPMQRRKDS